VDNGIFPGGSKNKAYRELFVRWFEYGAFCPLFRVHGTDTPREVWRFGQPGTWAYDALVKTDKLRYRLLPYIYSLAWKITNDNYTMMRGLDFDFQNDPKVRNIWNEFMFGPSILVNPVTEPGETARQVYLPSGANWTDFWSGEQYEGGQAIQISAPIDHIPLLVKQGSIIPMGPVIQYASEKPEDPLELRIYPGANAHFTMYEDEDDNYDYEKGIYSTITFDWDNSSKTLTIRNRKGSFPGMLKNRTIHIVLVNKNHGTGLSVTQKPDKTVIYDGNKISVSF
jgi:alpha-D-xyloside xylohydrolase